VRIHSDWLDSLHLTQAVSYAQEMLPEHGTIWIEQNEVSGSKSRKRAITFRLEGDGSHSKRKTNSGKWGGGENYAATWDQWGYVLAFLFDVDPKATVSTGHKYDGYDNYHAQTKGAYLLTDLASRAVLLTRWEGLQQAGRKYAGRDFYMPAVPMRILREEGY
jgi:hypothetical protein